MPKKRVVIAMSGGVDSSVAASLLVEQGYDVIGITMCFGTSLNETGKKPGCCGWDAIDDAKKVAGKLGIKHYVLNFGKIFKEKVIDDFIASYLKGETPNPCVRCNQFIKFDALFKKAKELDVDYLATGHYARIEYDKQKKDYCLKKGQDKQYDQSYFLYSLNKKDFPHFLLPLGKLTKEKVRQLAKKFKLAVENKPSSQDVCFAAPDYRKFLMRHAKNLVPGEIKLADGSVVGLHRGIGLYTIGQREGLGIALGKPAYVNKIDARTNSIVVGDKKDCLFQGCLVEQINFLSPKKTDFVAIAVKIRYNHKAIGCKVSFSGKRARILFKQPQFAVTPGQSAVVYQKDQVLFGGKIVKAIL